MSEQRLCPACGIDWLQAHDPKCGTCQANVVDARPREPDASGASERWANMPEGWRPSPDKQQPAQRHELSAEWIAKSAQWIEQRQTIDLIYHGDNMARALDAQAAEITALKTQAMGYLNEKVELRKQNAALREALTDHESPQLWRIEWLAGLVQTLEEGGVDQLRAEWDEDPSAMSEMLLELRGMVTDARAALEAGDEQ